MNSLVKNNNRRRLTRFLHNINSGQFFKTSGSFFKLFIGI